MLSWEGFVNVLQVMVLGESLKCSCTGWALAAGLSLALTWFLVYGVSSVIRNEYSFCGRS